MRAPRLPRLSLLLASLGLFACGSPVVGAECAPGFSLCGERCLDLQNDPDHCGACDQSCGRFECLDAECGPSLRPDADAGVGSDGGLFVDDGLPFLQDGGFAFPDVTVGRGCDLGASSCGNRCTDLRLDPANCGECGVGCPTQQYCLGGVCMTCDPPLMLCGGCVDLKSDANNCGECGHPCRSGICEGGVCTDLLTGHLVVIGQDYGRGRPSATALRLMGNTVFLAPGSPVQTIVYEGTATAASIDGVTAAIDFVVEKDGRQWAPRSVAADDLGAELRDADALLVHSQAGSSDAQLLELGQQVGLALSQFLSRGGVIVVVDGMSTQNAGTFQLLEPAGLFEAGSRETIGTQTLRVTTPGVGVAARATRSYRSPDGSVRFLEVTTPGARVVIDGEGEAVIIHRIVIP